MPLANPNLNCKCNGPLHVCTEPVFIHRAIPAEGESKGNQFTSQTPPSASTAQGHQLILFVQHYSMGLGTCPTQNVLHKINKTNKSSHLGRNWHLPADRWDREVQESLGILHLPSVQTYPAVHEDLVHHQLPEIGISQSRNAFH